jgi:hypothetical protein
MRSRLVRLGLVLLLLGAGAAAIVEGRRARTRSPDTDVLDARVDGLLATLVDLGTAQAEYVATGQDAASALSRAPELLRRVSTTTGEISQFVQAPAASRALGAIADAGSRLAQADARARDSLLLGDTATASYVIFGDARQASVDMAGALATLRATEAAARDAQRQASAARAWKIAEAAAALWIVGLLALAVLPGAPRPPDTAKGDSRLSIRDRTPRTDANLGAVADLCTGIARVTTTDALASLLERAAELFDADAVTIWLSAGDGLTAVRSHGPNGAAPDPDDGAHDAAVGAWREQRLTAEHTASGSRVVAAPIFGPDACTGVLTIEARGGEAMGPFMHAVAAIIAAQLATVLPAGPAAASSAPSRATG